MKSTVLVKRFTFLLFPFTSVTPSRRVTHFDVSEIPNDFQRSFGLCVRPEEEYVDGCSRTNTRKEQKAAGLHYHLRKISAIVQAFLHFLEQKYQTQ